MDYYLYEPLSNGVRAEVKKACKKYQLDYKRTSWQHHWGDWISTGLIQEDVSSPVVILENQWFKEPICLLPESNKLISQILGSNFEGQVDALKSPYEQFTIAIPKGVAFNGEIIKGIFASYVTSDRKVELTNNFAQEHKVKIASEKHHKAEYQLCIVYKDPNGAGRIVNTVKLTQLGLVLQAENIEEYGKLTEYNSSKEVFCGSLTDSEKATQFEVIRFVVGFIIYISAHQDSVKSTKNIKMKGVDKGIKPLSLETIRHFKPDGTIKPHYRNLRHEKFYRNEWSDWLPGSRWVPVNMITESVEKVKT